MRYYKLRNRNNMNADMMLICKKRKEEEVRRKNMKVMFSSQRDNWKTSQGFYKALDSEFNFDHDHCPSEPKEDGLVSSWGGCSFVNHPYSDISNWMKKGYKEWQKGKTIVFLIPSRTDTRWWREYCMKATKKGTSGYLLSEEQIQKILFLITEREKKAYDSGMSKGYIKGRTDLQPFIESPQTREECTYRTWKSPQGERWFVNKNCPLHNEKTLEQSLTYSFSPKPTHKVQEWVYRHNRRAQMDKFYGIEKKERLSICCYYYNRL